MAKQNSMCGERSSTVRFPADEIGIQQAKIAGTFFSNNQIGIDHAYSSTSERASDTLENRDRQSDTLTSEGPERMELRRFRRGKWTSESLSPLWRFFEKFGGECEEQMRERLANTLETIMDSCWSSDRFSGIARRSLQRFHEKLGSKSTGRSKVKIEEFASWNSSTKRTSFIWSTSSTMISVKSNNNLAP